MRGWTCLAAVGCVSTQALQAAQTPFHLDHAPADFSVDHGPYHPTMQYPADSSEATRDGGPPLDMTLHPLHRSGPSQERVDLTFFADGYTQAEEAKFIEDARILTEDIVREGGAMGHVAHLLNVWGVFVPSATAGIGVNDTHIKGAPFGLYRSGAELRGVYVKHHRRARAACRYFREESENGGCDQAILLGNDPLYGGLGGELTVITASKLNGPLVLRHELGHSLIPVGEEYEGGFAYFGANSDKEDHLHRLKWKDQLSDPANVRVEDVKVPLQVYPWYNLSSGPYEAGFESANRPRPGAKTYPSAHMRISMSSIPHPDHVQLTLNAEPIDLGDAFLPAWNGSKDRRWLEIPLPHGIPAGRNTVTVSLTKRGQQEPEGQGGKMITSLEVMEYGGDERFNAAPGFIGAFPTYSIEGKVTLRPTNEECLMRKVNHPTFCPICAKALEKSLLSQINKKRAGT